ncbi:hypothetical protein [Streptomyces sp. NPDC058202]|uniref:hypothetical protein n=1 Tax=Streptomyces sp. NPDC058202 TaxID=3346380 RepID=UPI0036EA2316
MTRPISDLDVPLATVQQLVARQRFAARMEPLAAWLAHPEAAPHTPAPDGERFEQRHWLYDADPDSTEPPFPYPNALEAS